MKKFEIGKKYVLHSNNKTYECTVKARNEIYKPYSVYIILDIKVTMTDNEYKYTRAYRVMDTSYDYECECVELTNDYYGSILTANNDLNDGKLHYSTLNYIKNHTMLRVFLLEHKCMQLPQQSYDMILQDIITHHNLYYTSQQIASRYDFSFDGLYKLFTHCINVFNYYTIDTDDVLLDIISDDRISLQLMHNIVEYCKIVYSIPKYKDKLINMIDLYECSYRDYINRFTY